MQCSFAKHKVKPPACPPSPELTANPTGQALASAILQATSHAPRALDAISRTWTSGPSNPPPSPELRAALGGVHVPLAVNGSAVGLSQVLETIHVVSGAVGEEREGWVLPDPHPVSILTDLLRLLRLHVRYMTPPAQGEGLVWEDLTASLARVGGRITSITATDSASSNPEMRSLHDAWTAAQMALDAAQGGSSIAAALLAALQRREDSPVLYQLLTLIPTAMSLTRVADRPVAVKDLTAALLRTASHSPGVAFPHRASSDAAGSIPVHMMAWSALGAMLNDTSITGTLSGEDAQVVVDTIITYVSTLMQQPPAEIALGVAMHACHLLSSLNRAPTPAIAEAVPLSALLSGFVAALLGRDSEAVSRTLLKASNLAVARAQKAALQLLYNVCFGAFAFHTPVPTVPALRAVRPLWHESLYHHLGHMASRGAVLGYT